MSYTVYSGLTKFHLYATQTLYRQGDVDGSIAARREWAMQW
jgi:hypothetical protein